VLQDSYTGVFATIYPHACYKQAIAKIPTADQIYGNTREEIQAAATAALNGKTYKIAGVSGTGTSAAAATSSHKSTVPTAIIVLAGVAIALLLIGGGGELFRRSRRSDT
jgi:hypothetical protein